MSTHLDTQASVQTLEEQVKQQEEANKVQRHRHDWRLMLTRQALQETLDQLKKKRKDLTDVSNQLAQMKIERDAVKNELSAARGKLRDAAKVNDTPSQIHPC